MEKKNLIENFAFKRPNSVGIYGYGSGIFKQDRKESTVPVIDVIFIVEDMVKWHQENMLMHPNDYSFLGKLHIRQSNFVTLKGKNRITYFSGIQDNTRYFKYGVMEVKDFLNDLDSWEHLFVAGRFHKPVTCIKTNVKLEEAVQKNRKYAFIVACLLEKEVVSKMHLFQTLCGLSYLGDVRMSLAENPHKVCNIVQGSYDEFLKVYAFDYPFLHVKEEMVRIQHELLLKEINHLPNYLLTYLEEQVVDLSDLDRVKEALYSFFYQKNKEESKAQILEGIKTNGIVRSVPYVLAKVRKRFELR